MTNKIYTIRFACSAVHLDTVEAPREWHTIENGWKGFVKFCKENNLSRSNFYNPDSITPQAWEALK
jgi:hypothetical protein